MAKQKGLSNTDKKALAYDLFMNTDMSQKEICARVNIREGTFTKWKQDNDWNIHKQAFSITSQNIVSNLLQKAYEESQEDKVNADQLLKLVKAIEGLSDRKVTISNVINVFKEFTTWCFDKNPDLAKEINQLQKEFVDHKINA